jgi:hypothetical protein
MENRMSENERWHELVRTVFAEEEADQTLEAFDTLELRELLQFAFQRDEPYISFRIGLELGSRGERPS